VRLLNLKIQSRNEAQEEIKEILDRAADNDGEFQEGDEDTLTQKRSFVESLDEQIAVLQKDAERAENAPKARQTVKTENQNTDSQARTKPRTYGASGSGFRQMLLDMAIVQLGYSTGMRGHTRAEAQERVDQYRAECEHSDNDYVRAIATSDLGGLVNPQFDPRMISRGIYDAAVTLMLLNRYPMWSSGDSLTLPRVTTTAAADVQTPENTAFHATKVVTKPVKADLFTVAAQAPISIQSVERGVLAVELLADEMMRAWLQRLNELILTGNANTSASEQPQGLLHQVAGTAGQFIEKDDASPTAAKAVDYFTDAKTAVWKADRQRVDCYVTSPGVVGVLEKAKNTQGSYLIPPYPAWAQNVGGAGTLPASEGPTAELEWRRVPIYADSAISDTWKDDGSSDTGGDQSRIIAMRSSGLPVFFDGPMSYSYDQTLAASGQVLLVARGYAAFNPNWRPESWRVVRGTGLKLGA